MNQPFPDFGQWLTYAEAVKSATALRRGIDNTPSPTAYDRMKLVYEHLYAPLCEWFGKVPVSSFFRSVNLNRAVGGSKNSQHVTGEAIDLDCDGSVNVTNRQLFDYIAGHLEFDQLINEAPDENGNPQWVHVSFRAKGKNRRQILTMQYVKGKAVYTTAKLA